MYSRVSINSLPNVTLTSTYTHTEPKGSSMWSAIQFVAHTGTQMCMFLLLLEAARKLGSHWSRCFIPLMRIQLHPLAKNTLSMQPCSGKHTSIQYYYIYCQVQCAGNAGCFAYLNFVFTSQNLPSKTLPQRQLYLSLPTFCSLRPQSFNKTMFRTVGMNLKTHFSLYIGSLPKA